MKVRLDWKGEQLRERVARAEAAAVEETVDAAAQRARADHPTWRSRTGAAEASIEATPAERTRDGARARFGFGVDYGPFLEHGFGDRPGDLTLERAAEAEFPELPQRIRREFA